MTSLNNGAPVAAPGSTPGPPISLALRQSPPPVTEVRPIPAGAIISPPESASGSDDESKANSQENLKNLRQAVSQISQGTPLSSDENLNQDRPQEIPSKSPMRISFSTTALSQYTPGPGCKISHSRSATEPRATLSTSADNSATISSESDDDLRYKPQMVRKKSGELVRPALRGASHRRPLSMPGTPVFSKAVHFDSHLEHVRHFLQVDRPLAVSAGSSPVEAYESDTEYPFPGGKSRGPPFEWELATTNFPHDNNLIRRALPARLERVWLSKDQKVLHASISVANLAFEKRVTCRFTLDGWKTTSEVTGEYTCGIDAREGAVAHDRFTIAIQLADMANLECKTLFFCIRYAVNGQEYWDNNSGSNFQVDFHKKHLPQRGKVGFQGASAKSANGLPRSTRRSGHGTSPRPVSMPASLDDFADEPGFRFDQPLHEYLGEASTGLRLKSKSFNNLASDNMIKSLATPSGAAFANRYDFGASLDAVKSRRDAPKDSDALYMKGNTRAPVPGMSPQTVTVPAPSATIASSSYEELVNKYCFFGAKPSSPQEVPPKPAALEPKMPSEQAVLAKYQVSPPTSPSKSSGPTVSTVEYAAPKAPMMRSGSPNFTPLTGTSPADVALHTQQTPDLFVPATAIRG